MTENELINRFFINYRSSYVVSKYTRTP